MERIPKWLMALIVGLCSTTRYAVTLTEEGEMDLKLLRVKKGSSSKESRKGELVTSFADRLTKRVNRVQWSPFRSNQSRNMVRTVPQMLKRSKRCLEKEDFVPVKCSSRPCKNGAKCVTVHSIYSYWCRCRKGYYGRKCEHKYRNRSKRILIVAIVMSAIVLLLMLLLWAVLYKKIKHARFTKEEKVTFGKEYLPGTEGYPERDQLAKESSPPLGEKGRVTFTPAQDFPERNQLVKESSPPLGEKGRVTFTPAQDSPERNQLVKESSPLLGEKGRVTFTPAQDSPERNQLVKESSPLLGEKGRVTFTPAQDSPERDQLVKESSPLLGEKGRVTFTPAQDFPESDQLAKESSSPFGEKNPGTFTPAQDFPESDQLVKESSPPLGEKGRVTFTPAQDFPERDQLAKESSRSLGEKNPGTFTFGQASPGVSKPLKKLLLSVYGECEKSPKIKRVSQPYISSPTQIKRDLEAASSAFDLSKYNFKKIHSPTIRQSPMVSHKDDKLPFCVMSQRVGGLGTTDLDKNVGISTDDRYFSRVHQNAGWSSTGENFKLGPSNISDEGATVIREQSAKYLGVGKSDGEPYESVYLPIGEDREQLEKKELVKLRLPSDSRVAVDDKCCHHATVIFPSDFHIVPSPTNPGMVRLVELQEEGSSNFNFSAVSPDEESNSCGRYVGVREINVYLHEA